jgi:peptide-methionine (R)-S-oxide reductase
MKGLVIFHFLIFVWSISCQTHKYTEQKNSSSPTLSQDSKFINMHGDTIKKVNKTPEEWRKSLTDMEYHVLREKGTERAFTGDLLDNKDDGMYTCRGCGMPLFISKHKYNSGSGWPSFYDVPDSAAITKSTDYDLGYARTELSCAKCGGHLGHVFDDGPKPTGQRYCINSVSLDFVKTEN